MLFLCDSKEISQFGYSLPFQTKISAGEALTCPQNKFHTFVVSFSDRQQLVVLQDALLSARISPHGDLRSSSGDFLARWMS